MNWECLLYGHHWRHPGEFEIVIVEDTPPSHTFECARCGDEHLLNFSPPEPIEPTTHATTESDQGGRETVSSEDGSELSSSG